MSQYTNEAHLDQGLVGVQHLENVIIGNELPERVRAECASEKQRISIQRMPISSWRKAK
jgi:hypothetical protein